MTEGNFPRSELVLIVDDMPQNVRVLASALSTRGYRIAAATSGRQALRFVEGTIPDLICLDIMMPEMDGFEVCRELKTSERTRDVPIIFLTAKTDTDNKVRGFELGAADYITKPFKAAVLLARVRTHLALSRARDELQERNAELDALNQNLEQRVREQVAELERTNRLRRFFSPQIVDAVVSDDQQDLLTEHRREVTVVFLDLRRFTSFAERAEASEVLSVLREMHECVGPILFGHGATLEHFTGDGLMAFLGDPQPIPDHAARAIAMSIEIRDEVAKQAVGWQSRGYDLALGIGLATGFASCGCIGFEGRVDYAAIGTVTNLAARICGKAAGGQILISQETKAHAAMEALSIGEVTMKGFSRPVPVYAVP